MRIPNCTYRRKWDEVDMVVRYHKTIKRADRGGAFHIRIRNRTYSRELVPREQSLGSY
ncbi:hypothetical protein M405DRAFT_834458, partial [Rhizopogon salebrosus TDB-379]